MTRPEANVIKLPNISASIPQLKATIEELRAKGFMVPDYPDEPQTDDERDVKARYDKVKGSAVNPVLREGNSDRRAPLSVKTLRQEAPALDGRVGERLQDATSRTMGDDDFFSNEQSVIVDAPTTCSGSSSSAPTAAPWCSRSRSRCSPARSSTARS